MTKSEKHSDGGFRIAAIALFIISGVINILALSGAIYMLQVYDRVLTSHNLETLAVLSILVFGLYIVFGVLDAIRSQILYRVASRFDDMMMPKAFKRAAENALAFAPPAQAAQSIRDCDTVRGIIASPAPIAVLDLPWVPVYLLFIGLLSVELAFATLLALTLLVTLAIVTNAFTRSLEKQAIAAAGNRGRIIEAALRNVEASTSMGFFSDSASRFLEAHSELGQAQSRSGDIVAVFSSASKAVRLAIQSAILGYGAYLAIKGQLSAGAIIAASIAATRSLSPAEQLITNWRSLATAWNSYRVLIAACPNGPSPVSILSMPRPRHNIATESLSIFHPGAARFAIRGVTVSLVAGQAVAIVGRSGSGKSTLAKALVGLVAPAHGLVKFDGVPIARWAPDDRGAFVGYMPQTIELFPVSIAENIARLDETPRSEDVIAAATAAGLHDAIVQLPQGYETRLELNGAPLSIGQCQQLGLARALFGKPFLLVLDEPNANLDSEAESSLIGAIATARDRGAIVVVVAHRKSLLRPCDHVIRLEGGVMTAFGEKGDVLKSNVASVPTSQPKTSIAPTKSTGLAKVTGVK